MSQLTVLIRMDPVWATIELTGRGRTPLERGMVGRALDTWLECLTVAQAGARWSRAYKQGLWDGKRRFYTKTPIRRFPTGLLREAIKALPTYTGPRIQWRWTEKSPDPIELFPALQGIALHAHQLVAAARGVKARRAVLYVGTAGGKTAIGAELIRQVGVPTLWLIHRTQLVEQTVAELQRLLGVGVGRYRGGAKEPGELVTVGTVQSLANIPAKDPFWAQWQMLIIDECHLASATTWYQIASRCVRAWYRFGLTGTPQTREPEKDYRMMAATGPVIEIASVRTLIDKGLIEQPTVYFITIPSTIYPSRESVRDRVAPGWRTNPRILTQKGGALFAETYREGVTRNTARNTLVCRIARRAAKAGKRVLVLSSRLEHLGLLAQDLAPYLPTGAPLEGKTPVEERLHAVDLFRTGRPGQYILLASPIFDAGVDVPEIDVLIQAGAGESPILINQRTGRALRKAKGKRGVLVFDFFDGSEKRDYLRLHAQSRFNTYTANGYALRHVTHQTDFDHILQEVL